MDLLNSLFLVIPLFSLITLFLIFFHNHSKSKKNQLPQPLLKSYPLLGTLPDLLKNGHRFLEWTTDILTHTNAPTNTLILVSPGTANGIITSDPRNVEHILKTNFANFPRGQRSRTLLHDFLGDGIFNSVGDHWYHLRKTASHEFNKRSLRNFVMHTVRDEIADRLLPLLATTAETGDTVDLQYLLERFGFDNICKVAFGEDPGCLRKQADRADFLKAFGDAQDLSLTRFFGVVGFTWRIKKMLDIGTERKLREAIAVVHGYAMEIIKKRKEKKMGQGEEEGGDDLLSRFAADENDHSEELLRDNIISFMVAGRDTTSSALTWFFWLLSSNPDVELKILREIRSIRRARRSLSTDETTPFSFDELRDMHYLHSAISESLRLYPPVPLDSQSCKDGDVLPDGTLVGKGWVVMYSAYAMGRMESIWGEDCRVYRPERWLEKGGVFRPESPFRFPVFHAGPRMCLGKEMAYIQMKSVVASVVERFKIRVAEESKNAEPMLSLTLRMKGGLHVRVQERW